MNAQPLNILVGGTPPAERKIDDLWAWIAVHADGGEGIISADMPIRKAIRHMALVSSRLYLAEAFRPIAEVVRSLSEDYGRPMVPELVHFVREPSRQAVPVVSEHQARLGDSGSVATAMRELGTRP
jgi:hypothetical protein